MIHILGQFSESWSATPIQAPIGGGGGTNYQKIIDKNLKTSKETLLVRSDKRQPDKSYKEENSRDLNNVKESLVKANKQIKEDYTPNTHSPNTLGIPSKNALTGGMNIDQMRRNKNVGAFGNKVNDTGLKLMNRQPTKGSPITSPTTKISQGQDNRARIQVKVPIR